MPSICSLFRVPSSCLEPYSGSCAIRIGVTRLQPNPDETVLSKEVVIMIRKLEKAQWRSYFDTLSKLLEAKEAEIEVASLDLGDQVQARWLPFLGIAYDPQDDVVEVALEGLDHMIYRPREVYVDDEVGGLTSIEIVDANGANQIVKLKDKLLLPAPSH